MTRVYYSCPFVPTELIAACGHTPCPVRAMPSGRLPVSETEGICLWSALFVQQLLDGAAEAAVFTTACDQMRRSYELYRRQSDRPAFLLNIPKSDTPLARQMLTDEYVRLLRFLEETLGGRLCQDALMQSAAECTSEPSGETGTGVAVIGGPLQDGVFAALRQRLAERGVRVVFDGTETAWRNYCTPCRPSHLAERPCEALAESYLTMPVIWKRPGLRFFDWLCSRVKAANTRGVMVIQHPFCDYWRAGVYDIRHSLSIPVTCLETGENGTFSAAAISRLEAFLEQLQQ